MYHAEQENMETKPLISIIAATYKAEEYLPRFFNSIIPQTRECEEGVEIIIVDDASPDASREIAIEWRKKHDCIRIVSHESNKGAAAARNTGIASACGEYIMFVDPDDALAPGALACLVPVMRDVRPDMIRYRFRRVIPNGAEHSLSPELHGNGLYRIHESPDALRIGFLDFAFHMGSSAGAFRRAAAPDVWQRTDHIIAEDLMFGWDFFRRAKTVYCIPEILYLYYQYPHSVSHSDRSRKMIDGLMAMNIDFWNGARKFKGFDIVAKDVFDDLFRMMTGWHYNLVFNEVRGDEWLETRYFDAFCNFLEGPGSRDALGALHPLAKATAATRSRVLLKLFVFTNRQIMRVQFHLDRILRRKEIEVVRGDSSIASMNKQ